MKWRRIIEKENDPGIEKISFGENGLSVKKLKIP